MALSYYSSPFYREGQRSELASELARGGCCVCVMNVNSINAIWIRANVQLPAIIAGSPCATQASSTHRLVVRAVYIHQK